MNSSRTPIFVSTSCLPGVETIASRVHLYQSHGLNAIELGAGISADEDSLCQVAEMDCRLLVHNYFPPPLDSFVLNLASKDAKIREKSISFVSEAISLVIRLNAQFYSVHAGFITDPTSFGLTSFFFPSPASPDEAQYAFGRFTASLNAVLDSAQRQGVDILIENNICSQEMRGKLLLQTAEEFQELFRSVQAPHLGMLLDTGHLNVSAHTFGFDRMTFVEEVIPYVRAIHIHDNDGISDTHKPVQSGSWVLDVLQRTEFSSLPIIIEAKFETVTNLCRHVDWLRRELRRE